MRISHECPRRDGARHREAIQSTSGLHRASFHELTLCPQFGQVCAVVLRVVVD
jgi:hypothetical protein